MERPRRVVALVIFGVSVVDRLIAALVAHFAFCGHVADSVTLALWTMEAVAIVDLAGRGAHGSTFKRG